MTTKIELDENQYPERHAAEKNINPQQIGGI